MELIEKVRLTLWRWYVAPLIFASVIVWSLVNAQLGYNSSPCELSEWATGGHYAYVTGLCALLYKVFGDLLNKREGDEPSRDM